MDLTTALYIGFISMLIIAGIASWVYYHKQYALDPITGEFIAKREIHENAIRRKEQDSGQLIYDELSQINESMKRIGEVCPEFHQKYGKAMNILCHIDRMKVLIHEYEDIPDEESLINYQHQFYFKVYDSIQKDIYIITSPYFTGKEDVDPKYRNKIDLRIEVHKFLTHLKKLKSLSISSN